MIDDRSLVTREQLFALRRMLRDPNIYTQRLVEHLDFLPEGGQSWRREIQQLTPKVEKLEDDTEYWYIVSLGQFRRRRLPDFTVTDCAGRTVNLLTRFQHGHALTQITLDQYLGAVNPLIRKELHRHPEGAIATAWGRLYEETFEMFTSIEVAAGSAAGAEKRLASVMSLAGVEASRAGETAALFREDMDELGEVTQYLCWVRARPKSAVQLRATYTMPDPAHVRPHPPWRQSSRKARSFFTEQYARFGVGPMRYEILTPANDHAASYYFTMHAPPESHIAYMDWGLANSIEDDEHEWSCASHSIHVHNGPTLKSPSTSPAPRTKIPGSKIHAFVRLDAIDHKQVVIAAVLNLVFVWLAEAGRLTSELGSSATPWLAFAPAALVAYVAQQQRHYFARATSLVRFMVWGYLTINLGFLVSITYDIASDGSFAARHGFTDDLVSIAMATSSVGIAAIFVFVGRPYNWVVGRRFRIGRWWTKRKKKTRKSLDSYLRASRGYGDLAVCFLIFCFGALAFVVLDGRGPNEGGAEPPGIQQEAAVGNARAAKQAQPGSAH